MPRSWARTILEQRLTRKHFGVRRPAVALLRLRFDGSLTKRWQTTALQSDTVGTTVVNLYSSALGFGSESHHW